MREISLDCIVSLLSKGFNTLFTVPSFSVGRRLGVIQGSGLRTL